MVKTVIETLYELIVIGKTAAKDIQMKTDVRARRLIEKYYEISDLVRLRRICLKNHLYLKEEDIIGIDLKTGGVIVKLDYLINSRQVYRELIRCRRRTDV